MRDICIEKGSTMYMCYSCITLALTLHCLCKHVNFIPIAEGKVGGIWAHKVQIYGKTCCQ